MPDEEFERKLAELVEMLRNLRQIKDRGLKPWLKVEVKELLRELLKD